MQERLTTHVLKKTRSSSLKGDTMTVEISSRKWFLRETCCYECHDQVTENDNGDLLICDGCFSPYCGCCADNDLPEQCEMCYDEERPGAKERVKDCPGHAVCTPIIEDYEKRDLDAFWLCSHCSERTWNCLSGEITDYREMKKAQRQKEINLIKDSEEGSSKRKR